MLALYLAIWIALVLFVAGEAGRARSPALGPPPAWAWWAFASGLALAILHTILAFHIVHDWSHADAVRNTSSQTEAVFGVGVGWGVYVNYVFFAVWFADAWWWRASRGAGRPASVTWTLRAFYLVIIVNAAVVFASPARRVLGLAVVTALIGAWMRRRQAPAAFFTAFTITCMS
jgi:hypothetical protein